MAVRNYQELHAWQKAMQLVKQVYIATRSFPDDERFGLSNQLRRAAVSIPSNIAEGQGRGTATVFKSFLRIAHGSLREVETQILIAADLGYLDERQKVTLMDLAGEVGRLLNGLMRSI